jgi:hypothetical protein
LLSHDYSSLELYAKLLFYRTRILFGNPSPRQSVLPAAPRPDKITKAFDPRHLLRVFAKGTTQGGTMNRKTSIFDSVAALALIGILAGALGGLAVGIVTGHASSSSASTSSSSSSTTH